jgi:3-oxoadipate enol-lactonase
VIPLVLLHGLGTGPAGWRPQVEAFSASRVVVAPRLYGRGPLDVDDAAERLDRALAEGAHDVCGLSLGALVALRYALDRPGRVRRLVLCAGLARLSARQRRQVRAVALLMRALPSRLVVRQLVAEVDEAHRDAARDALAGLRSRDLAETMRRAAGWDVRDELPSLATPTLVLCGERDRANLPLSQELAAALPDARFLTVPGAGHVANLDAPAAFNEAVGAFLDA